MRTLGKRIKFARDSIGLTQQKFADILKISRASIAKYENDEIIAGGQVFISIYHHTSINLTWLLTGEGDPTTTPLPQDFSDLVVVPLGSAILSAGGESFGTNGNTKRSCVFKREFLESKGCLASMVLMHVTGDSMEPEIRDKDLVLIDQSQAQFVAFGIYAVALSGMIYLKKITAMPDRIILESINPSYPPVVIEPCNMNSVRILGRAIWWCREAV